MIARAKRDEKRHERHSVPRELQKRDERNGVGEGCRRPASARPAASGKHDGRSVETAGISDP